MTWLMIAGLLAILAGMFYLGRGTAHDCWRCIFTAAVLITVGTIVAGLVMAWAR